MKELVPKLYLSKIVCRQLIRFVQLLYQRFIFPNALELVGSFWSFLQSSRNSFYAADTF